jgi:hypothetical protein
MRTTFHFSITGIQKGKRIKFTVQNMNNVKRLYNNGLKPTFRVQKDEKQKSYKCYREFKHIPGKIDFNNLDDNLFLSWSHDFTQIDGPDDTTFFCFNFPYSYQDGLSLSETLYQRVEEYNGKSVASKYPSLAT